MDNLQQLIYNLYNKITREQSGKLYRFRKNFDNLDIEVKNNLIQLSKFFNRFPNIQLKLFLEAPYKIYNEKYFPLEYYLKRKALQNYTMYRRKLIGESPDNEYNITESINTLKFIKNYIQTHDIKLSDYLTFKEGYTYAFVEHLRSGLVSIYVLFEFEDFRDVFQTISDEDKKFIFGETFINWDTWYRKFKSSNNRRLVQKGFAKIQNV